MSANLVVVLAMASISTASLVLRLAPASGVAIYNLLGLSDQRIDLIRGVDLSALVFKACDEFLQ
jgi:hypothetical protein